MNTTEKIRAEIERLIKENDNIRCDSNKAYCQGYGDAFVDLFQFLSTLEEPVSEDLEEAAEEYETKHTFQLYDGGGFTPEYDTTLVDAFKAGAEWQARQLLQDSPMPEDTLIFRKGVEEGKRLMMEEAENGKELLYVCDKSYKIGYRDGKRDAEQKQKGGNK